MDYLFFDIECANCDGGNGKICSFGYTLIDHDYNILEKKDIVINPRAPFRLRGYGKKLYIQLAYPEEEFKNAPDFTEHYNLISSLLTAENRMIFGYAPENDAGFLRSEFERYSLSPVNFIFYDVQRLYKYASGTENTNLCSLMSACEGLEIDTSFIEHKSCDDAYATMMVLKKLCEKHNKRPEELVNIFTPCQGELKNGEIYADYFKPKTDLKEGEENFIKGINRDKFKQIVRRSNNICSHGSLYGKKIAFSWIYEYHHFNEMCKIVGAIAKKGGRYTYKISNCDIFVKKPEESRGICKKLAEAEKLRETSKSLRPAIMSFNSFLSLIDVTKDELSEITLNKQAVN